MSTSTFALATEAAPLQRLVKTLINDDLKKILRAEGLAVAGVKAQLQDRILTRLNEYVASQDVQAFNRLRYRIHNPRSTADPPSSYVNAGTHSSHLHSPTSPLYARDHTALSSGYRPSHGPPAGMRTHFFPARVQFKPSPFYETKGNVTVTTELPKCEAYRQTHSLRLETSSAMLDDPSKRIMLYCAADPVGGVQLSDISFPHQIEVKVNSQEVKSNFRGLKNKPGSTRPADITSLLNRSQMNYISVTYAQTHKKFYIMAVLVTKKTVEDLVEGIKKGRMISKDTVLAEMRSKAADPDIIAMSTVMSLKDPVSARRISVPCRSTVCSHNQCFDAESFLQLQEQAPTWTCPICNKYIAFANLAVDQFVQEILTLTSSSTEQVTIEPNGHWQPVDQSNGTRRESNRKSSPAYSDDDLIEITDHRITNIKNEMANTPPSIFGRTPPASSREASTPTSAAPRSGSKRKSEVIDLTLSSDDDEPVRPPKRYQPYSHPQAQPLQPNGYRKPSNNVLPPPPPSLASGGSSSFQPFHVPHRMSSNSRDSLHSPHQSYPIIREHSHYGSYLGPGSSSSPPNS